MILPLVVALALGGVGVYIAYRNPRLGAAILVGLGIVTVLYLIWEKDPSVFQTGVPSVSTSAPVQTPPAGAPASGTSPMTPPPPSPTTALR